MKRINFIEFDKWKDNIKKTDYLLDIGCWDGEGVLKLNNKCNAYGIDINKNKLMLANPIIKKKLKYADATKNIPFTRKFNWIVLSEVIEHVDNDQKLLKNIAKSLKIGGKLILTTPRSIPFFEFYDPAWIRWKFGGKLHNHYNLKKLEEKMLKNNLKIKEYSYAGNIKWLFFRWLNVFIKYILKKKEHFIYDYHKGYFDVRLIAEKIK